MKYFLFLNHPKGEKIYKLSEKREYILREYFKSVNTITMPLEIEGKVYDCVVQIILQFILMKLEILF